MALNISEGGLLLQSSPEAMSTLPTQAFAITLSSSVIADMVACVQNGGDIQLSLGSNPRFLFSDREIRIPKSPEASGYDLFYSNSENPSSVNRLPNQTMSIFDTLRNKPKIRAPKALKVQGKGEKTVKTAPARASTKPTNAASKPPVASVKEPSSQDTLDSAVANLKSSLAKAEAEKRENAAVVVGNLPSAKGGKVRPSKRLLDAQAAASPRSLPPSPALSGIQSPSLGPTSNSAQDKVKQQRFPVIHELAAQDLTFQELLDMWSEGTQQELSAVLNKVADFDDATQKWILKKMYWKELDVFEYNYAQEEDRQRAINNAIKQYDRMRLGASDPLWQKLLPKSERGKGICLSKLQAAIAKGPSMPAPKQKADAASASGGDSEKDDSASTAAGKGKGGEAMSRSSSQTSTGKKKLSPSEAQAKRLLSNNKKPTAAKAKPKASPKVAATKTAAKTPGTKGGRVLSKEFVSSSDSDSDSDDLPLSTSMAKSREAAAPPSKPTERPVEKPKTTEKSTKVAAAKPKPVPAVKTLPREKDKDKEDDTIRAQVIAKPISPPTKRPHNADDDDTSSSGTPLSKRAKPTAKAPSATVGSIKSGSAWDTNLTNRGTGSGTSLAKQKNTSPMKSSPLASSPPTNASDLEQERSAPVGARERNREREHDRAPTSKNVSGNADSSINVGTSKKRPASDSSTESKAKRQRLSQDTIEKASKFKEFYARYEQLHHEMVAVENPDPDKMSDLLDLRDLLSQMKNEIYASVDA
ncbi:hypothetical protein VTK56DRAFT_1828 [Thermocarpiscus australiensis]